MVEAVKEKTGSFGQEVAFIDKGAGQEQQETGTATEENLALMCRQKIRRFRADHQPTGVQPDQITLQPGRASNVYT